MKGGGIGEIVTRISCIYKQIAAKVNLSFIQQYSNSNTHPHTQQNDNIKAC